MIAIATSCTRFSEGTWS